MTKDFEPQKGSGYHRPRLSPEEWKAQKQAEREELFQMIDETAVELATDPEVLRGYLDTQSRMDRYSVANALLIYRQYPRARQLRDFESWAAEQISIQKGAKSIAVLEPVEYLKGDGSTGLSYHIKKMFDVSQTKARPQAYKPVSQNPRALAAVMLDASPVEVCVEPQLPDPNMGAYFDERRRLLTVKRDLGDSVALCQSVAHELGHAQLALTHPNYNRRDLGFQALCIGYMLCRKYGVDTQVFDPFCAPDAWKGMEARQIREELVSIRSAMQEIHGRVMQEQSRKAQNRSQEPSGR